MIKIKSIGMKNFQSVGAVTQSVVLDDHGLTLVIGDNLDQGGNGNRNGVGKSTILNAMSYALFGTAISNIKVDNLINKINQKNMCVSIEFEKQGHVYKIERGRKPNFFRYTVDDNFVNEANTDESQGESRNTQEEINKVLGFNGTLFKHIIALNTLTDPFLNLGSNKQREIIEELLGITQLSQKSEHLKEQIKNTKQQIDQEEFRIKTVKNYNEKLKNTIKEIEIKINSWSKKHKETCVNLQTAIDQLSHVDIEKEIENHKILVQHRELTKSVAQQKASIMGIQRNFDNLAKTYQKELDYLSKAQNHECHACGQKLHNQKQQQLIENLTDQVSNSEAQLRLSANELDLGKEKLDNLQSQLDQLGQEPNCFYETIEEAYNHKNTIQQLQKDLERENNTTNPFVDHIATLESNMQEVTFDDLNALAKYKEHQEFLLKLLTNKDSFIRKRIIDQNLSYLNARLGYYLEKVGLPHTVKFLNDLSVEISILGQDLDFDNLSRGERNRLILGLSWAFRDIFETINNPVNILMIDELLDNGMDPAGIENSVAVLKTMVRERAKNIFVISHREELLNRVENILTVVKENGFTSFSNENETI